MAMSRTSPAWTIVNDFHIEKSRLPVVVVTTSGDRVTGDLFVQASARNPNRLEEAPEVLNSAEPFFPLATLSGRVLLCAKAHVRELHVPREETSDEQWGIGTRAEVAIEVAGGTLFKGTIIIEQETARQRVLDYLNRLTQRFVQLFTAQGVVLINREHVVHVEQVS
ncbi:MAG: hypothetical protein ACT4P7_07110 [Gemmatimonadaceae bacterium]